MLQVLVALKGSVPFFSMCILYLSAQTHCVRLYLTVAFEAGRFELWCFSLFPLLSLFES